MKVPRLRHDAGLGWAEVLVGKSIVVVAIFSLPFLVPMECKSPITQVLSNMRQLQIATQQMAQDGEGSENSELGWPGDTGGTFSAWSHGLVPVYLATNDFSKLLSTSGRVNRPSHVPTMRESAVLVYTVNRESASNTVLFTSANFTNTPAGGAPLDRKATPFGNKAFVIMHKDGSGQILNPRQVGRTDIIGAYAPLCR